jgi:hypothetical protein
VARDANALGVDVGLGVGFEKVYEPADAPTPRDQHAGIVGLAPPAVVRQPNEVTREGKKKKKSEI